MEYTQAACRRRRLGWAVRVAIAGTGVLTILGMAAPAAADVAVTPTEATQGQGADLTFQISNESQTASITAIEIQLPLDTPIAEVYPLSVPDWAPAMTNVPVDKPVESLHGYNLTDVTSAIKWTAMPGRALPPGGKTTLFVSMGPMPKAERMSLAFVITNSDGTQVRWTAKPGANAAPGERPAPVLVLKAAPAGQDDQHGAVHGGAAGSDPAAADATGNDAASAPRSESSYGQWVLLTLLLIVAISIFSLVLQRRRSADQRETGPTTAEPSNVDDGGDGAADGAAPEPEQPKAGKRMAAARSGPAP